MTEYADIHRIGYWEVDRELHARQRFGQPYRNRLLESKRRSAILYLKYRSACGWWMDKLK
jgi:hypothetical protein